MKGRLHLWKAGEEQKKDGARNTTKKKVERTRERTKKGRGAEKESGRVERGDARSRGGGYSREQMA